MEDQRAPHTTVEHIKRWLLARRHMLQRQEAEQTGTLVRLCTATLIGWALTRAPLLFSVNPLPSAAVIASSHSTIALLSGILLGLWQGNAPHPAVTLLSIAVGLLSRLCLRLFFFPAGEENEGIRRQFRHDLLCHLKTRLHRLWHNPVHPETASRQFPPLPVSQRTLSAAVGGVAGAVLLCINGNFSFYDLWGAALLLLLSPIACALYCFSFDAPSHLSPTLRVYLGHSVGIVSVFFCLRGLSFFYLSPAVIVLLAFSLYLVAHKGLYLAAGALLLGGIAIDVTILPPLLVALLLYALLHRGLGRAALLLSIAGSLIVTFSGGKGLFLALAPSVCFGGLMASVLLTLQAHHVIKHPFTQSPYRHDATVSLLIAEKRRCDRLTARLCTMAGAFDAVSEIMAQNHLAPADDMTTTPHAPSLFSAHCAAMASVLRDAGNENAATLTADDTLSQQLGKALREQGAQFRHSCVLTAGNGRCRVQLHGCSPAHLGMEEQTLHRLAERITGATLYPPEFDEGEEDGGMMILRPRPILSVSCSFRTLAAEDTLPSCPNTGSRPHESKKAPHCGDSIRFFTDGQDRFCALLCDGMGTGEDAALTSRTAVLLLERLLRAGVGYDTALSLLNLCLRSRAGHSAEITSTVDLMTLDSFSGRARFIKSGAADTLILRDGQLFIISSRTYPLGILSGVDMQVIPFSLRMGDCVILMSDGVADALLCPAGSCFSPSEDASAAVELSDDRILTLVQEHPPLDDSTAALLAERILQLARELGGGDDMTIALLRIVKNGGQ